MTALAELLFANGLPQLGAFPAATPPTASGTPTAGPQNFLLLLEQLFAAGDAALPTQMAATNPAEGEQVLATLVQSLLGQAASPSQIANGPANCTSQSEQISLVGQMALPAQTEEPIILSPEDVESWLQQVLPAVGMPVPEALLANQRGAIELQPDAIAYLQLSYSANAESATSADTPQWQVLLPITAESGVPSDGESLPVILVSSESAELTGRQPVILPATVAVAESELPKLAELIHQVQQAQDKFTETTPKLDVGTVEPATGGTQFAKTILPRALPLAGASAEELIVIETKLTIDTKVLDRLLTQTVQQNASQVTGVRPEHASLHCLPQAPASLPIHDTQNVLLQNSTPLTVLAVHAGDAPGESFVDLQGDSQENLPQQNLPRAESAVGQLGGIAAPSESFAESITRLEPVPQAVSDDKWDNARIHFTQSQLNSLLKRGEVKMQLSPPELGELKIELHSRENQMTARFELRSEAARQIVEHNLPHLRESMERAGIKVGQFEVALSSDGEHRQPASQPHPATQNSALNDMATETEPVVEARETRITHLGRINLIA